MPAPTATTTATAAGKGKNAAKDGKAAAKDGGKVVAKTDNGPVHQVTGFKASEEKTEEDTQIVAENPEQTGENYIKAQQNLPDVTVIGGDPGARRRRAAGWNREPPRQPGQAPDGGPAPARQGRPGRREQSRRGQTGAAAVKEPAKPEESPELLAQRDRLLEKFTVMQADLGGAFYEMAIRDHVRMDVLTRKAAELQRVDAELLAVERELELQREDAAGLCPGCSAPYGHGVRFCAQCGHALVPAEAAK